jgi:dienelactone hydrolase
MSLDPFARGPHPVGVRTVTLEDASRGRRLVAEVWYPAAESVRGQDLDAATRDRYPLFPGFPEAWQLAARDAAPASGAFRFAVFSHGFAGHRRQSTFFTTHLASHGFVVASVDHAGNTFVDLFSGGGALPVDAWATSMAARPRDVRFLIDRAVELGAASDRDVVMTGHSFGGWTSYRTAAEEPRIGSIVALAPAIGVPALRDAIDFGKVKASALVIAADRDSLLPLAPLEDAAASARFAVIVNTDHMHFCDGARQIHEIFRSMPMKIVQASTALPPFDELAPAKHGHDAACGLGLAHVLGLPEPDLAARGIPARVRW